MCIGYKTWACLILELDVFRLFLYNSAVMGSELDKIEKSGNEVANHPRTPKEIGIQLKKEVEAC